MRFGGLHVLEKNGAAEGRTLAEARPVAGHREARGVPLRDRIPGRSLAIQGHDRDKVSEQRSAGLELLAVHNHMAPGVGEPNFSLGQFFGAELQQRVAEPDAFETLIDHKPLWENASSSRSCCAASRANWLARRCATSSAFASERIPQEAAPKECRCATQRGRPPMLPDPNSAAALLWNGADGVAKEV